MMNQTITKLLILLMTIISNQIKLIYALKEILKETKIDILLMYKLKITILIKIYRN